MISGTNVNSSHVIEASEKVSALLRSLSADELRMKQVKKTQISCKLQTSLKKMQNELDQKSMF